jgi:hypothetical protein
MSQLFRVVLVVVLGVIAVVLDMTLWNAWRTGHPYTTPIMGAVTRRGVSSADPMTSLFLMTALFNAGFLASMVACFFPGTGEWLKQKRDGVWPPEKQPDVGPAWICARCHEENPGNFEECWKCQRNRPLKSQS